ncbi:MAG: hypothetical protein ACJ8E3_01460 [Sphingomicrobium sp.]
MRFSIGAALALIAPAALLSQPVSPDLSAAVPIAGNWTYAAVSGGSEATFRNASALPQLTVRCTRATRRVAIAKPANAAAPFLSVWTDTAVRNVPASFNPQTAHLTAELATYDPLLDALAFSRGRIGVTVTGVPALIVPAFPEIARVIEDCRS